MRKFAAILLCCIFAFAQYARHISYLECRVLNTFAPATQQCDCEKLLVPGKKSESPAHNATNHLHFQLDEFFDKAYQITNDTIARSSLVLNSRRLITEPVGYYNEPWHPPCC